jgi:hypothetical protein
MFFYRIFFSMLLLGLAFPAHSAQTNSVQDIDELVHNITVKVAECQLIQREITYTHTTIPGIGQPSNTITGWFQQELSEDYFNEYPVLIENVYHHAGVTSSEWYFFLPDGQLVYCSSSFDNGYGENPGYTKIFYFLEGVPANYRETPDAPADSLNSELLEMAGERQTRADYLVWMFQNMYVPATCIFEEGL